MATLGNSKVITVRLSEEGTAPYPPISKETGWKLYMKRGDKFYFWSPFGKRTIYQPGLRDKLSHLKYGDIVDAQWS